MTGLTLAFAPLVAWWAIAAFAAAAALVLAYGAVRRARGIAWRFLALAVLLAILAEPSLVDKLAHTAYAAESSSPDELAKFLKTDTAKWKAVIASTGLKID